MLIVTLGSFVFFIIYIFFTVTIYEFDNLKMKIEVVLKNTKINTWMDWIFWLARRDGFLSDFDFEN